MKSFLKPLYEILKLNTRLFINTLEGVNDDVAQTRINDRTNNISFIALHLVDARYYLATFFKLDANNPFKKRFENVQCIEDVTEYPSLNEIKASWLEISKILNTHFPKLKNEDLAAVSPQEFPVDDHTIVGATTFLLDHESYHIGQLGLLRKYFNLEPMKYD